MKYIFLIIPLLFSIQISAQKSALNLDLTVKDIIKQYNDGQSFIENDSLDHAYSFFIKGLELATQIENDSLVAKGNFYLGSYFYESANYAESESYYNTALQEFTNLKNTQFSSNCNRQLALIYKKRSNFEKALFYNYESLKINESINNEIEIAVDLNKIANVYSRTKNFEAAENRLQQALKINQKHGNLKGIVDNISTLGAVAQRTKNFDKAIEYFKEGVKYADSLGLKRNQAILLGNTGSTYRSLKKYNESLNYLLRALVLKKELKRNGSTAHTLVDISETYLHMDDFTNAKKYALEAISFAKNENLELERYAYFLLSKSNYKSGNYKASYNDLEKYNWLNDSIFNINKARAINELNIQYDTEKRDLKIQVQESDIALLDAENKYKNQLLLFGGLGLLAVFSLVMLYRSKVNAKQRQIVQEQFSQNLISAQEEERTRISKDLHDSVGQQLTLIKKKAQNLNQIELSKMSNDALEEVRSISRDLYPATLKQLGFTQSVEQLVNDLDEGVDMFFTVEVDEVDTALDEEKSLNLYRFIQESLSNVIKHSNAKAVAVTITKNLNQIEAVVSDNGKGFNSTVVKNSLGLKTMTERIKMLKGTLAIKSRVDHGTTLIAQIPV